VAIHQGVIATIIITSATHDRAANGLRPPFTISGHCLDLPAHRLASRAGIAEPQRAHAGRTRPPALPTSELDEAQHGGVTATLRALINWGATGR
jgi:hypothetical protein